MRELIKAKEPFRFSTRYNLSELTGLRAANLNQLLGLLKNVPDSCIYHHTHSFLQQHQFLSPEPPNDFAYWVTEILGEDELGEWLASIDTVQFSNISSLRQKIIDTIESYLEYNPLAKLKFAKEEGVFHFIKSVSFILPMDYLVHDLREFADVLKKISIDSIYFHIFEARLRLVRSTNDFSNWIQNSIGDEELAHRIMHLDPYTHTLEDLRNTIVKIIEERIA